MIFEAINLRDIKKTSAEEVLNGIKSSALEPMTGEAPDYSRYDIDRDLILRFRDLLPYDDDTIETANKRLNKSCREFEGKALICPCCKKHLDPVGNDGWFCKFCGQEIRREPEREFGETIKDLRKERGLTQGAVAKEVGISNTRLCLIEKGEKVPSEDEVARLSHFYKCSVNKLFDQPAPREKCAVISKSYQDYDRATLEPKELKTEECFEGYESEYIYKCPTCDEEVSLSTEESLTVSLNAYEVTKRRKVSNDGKFCKHCGQALIRPVEVDRKKVVENYKFWIRRAIR